ncbi:MAG TPA: carboxypeptidase-like regulatory domain-containing protein [Draconibacterium sp.]|nr:carboxypeptidase-like regulatory domain-containing protein [Draconibacterium sp.]
MKTTISFSLFILICVLPDLTHAQLVTISGYVTHAFTGSAIENASVFEKHSEIGTISNKEGFFRLMLHPGHQNLSFSEDGYKTLSENIVLKCDTTIIVQLKPELSAKNRHRNDTELEAGARKNRNLRDTKHY